MPRLPGKIKLLARVEKSARQLRHWGQDADLIPLMNVTHAGHCWGRNSCG